MDYDRYFQFISKMTEKGSLYEKISIGFYSDDKRYFWRDLSLRRLKKEKFLVFFELENDGRNLIVMDFSLDFLLFYSVIIGEDAQLFEFDYGGKKCIAQRDVIRHLGIVCDYEKRVSPRDIYLKKFKVVWQSKILSEIKKYCKLSLQLDMDKIHIVSGSRVELFTPTLKNSHLALAREMGIPIVSLISNQYIRDSEVNVFDIQRHRELLSPLKSVEIFEKRFFTNDGKEVYSDVSTDFYVRLDFKELSEKIKNAQIYNFYTDSILKKLGHDFEIRISSSTGNFLFPIWKVSGSKYVDIKGLSHFKEITGMDFRADMNFLKEVYVLNSEGKEGFWVSKFLRDSLANVFSDLDDNVVEFESFEEVALKLGFCENPLAILKKEVISEEKVRKLGSVVLRLFEIIKQKSILFNHIPKFESETDFGKIMFGHCIKLERDLENFMSYPARVKFLDQMLMESKYVVRYIERNLSEKEDLYFACGIFQYYLVVLEIFDRDVSLQIMEEFSDLFSGFKFSFSDDFQKECEKYVCVLLDVSFASSKKSKIYVREKSNDILVNNLCKDFKKITDKVVSKKIILPNFNEIRKAFPNVHKEFYKQIKRIDIAKIESAKVLVGKREFFVKSEFYTIEDKFEGFKKISKNGLFDLYEKVRD